MHDRNAYRVFTRYHITSYKTLNSFRKEHNGFHQVKSSAKFQWAEITDTHKVLRQASGHVEY